MNVRQVPIILLFAIAATPAIAAEGNWLVRARAVNIQPDASSAPLTGIDVEDKWIPEVDISYFLMPNLALELILTYPQKHDVSLNGSKIGTVKHLPPTLLVQYHFMPTATFRPYVGAGINYTRFSNVNLASGTLDLEKNSVGPAIQVGFDIEVAKGMYLNVDVKKVRMETDVKSKATGATVSTLKIDPVLFGIGIGWRF